MKFHKVFTMNIKRKNKWKLIVKNTISFWYFMPLTDSFASIAFFIYSATY